MLNIFKYQKALSKNWPGGRRNATKLVPSGENGSVRVWNTDPDQSKPLPKAAALPLDKPIEEI